MRGVDDLTDADVYAVVADRASGGACLASGPDKGVVDHTGQVFGNPGLYVADASVLPRAPGLPPAMTIAALSERQAVLLSESASSTVRASRPG